ncbi:MAG: methionine synthase [Bacteroidaceae bacterium]|nr:methionine synthase [Bacteroidaceae bacterium]
MGETLAAALGQRILRIDGALGTLIQTYGPREEDFRGKRFRDLPGQMAGNNDLLCLSRPDIIRDIHRRYLDAGADIIETNTFSAQRISMADYHCEPFCREMNLSAAAICRELADHYTNLNPSKPRFVAGSVGPTNKTLSMSPDVSDPALRTVSFDEMSDAYAEQMTALIEGGVDALLIETVFDTLNAKAALYAAEEAMQTAGRRVPIMLSVTVADKTYRTLSGQTLQAFLASVSHADILSVGLNCSFGAVEMLNPLRQLAAEAPYYISVYPNAGLPNQLGLYDETPETMRRDMRSFTRENLVNIIGGCCGTTDAHIAAFEPLTKEGSPHIPVSPPADLWLSGLERLIIPSAKSEQGSVPSFTVIGERCNVAGSRKFLRLIKEKNYDEAIAIARKQIEDGARVIDINMDDALLDARKEMTHFLNLLASEPDIARVPIMIDSSNWEVIRAALRCIQGKGIVNSISLKEGEESFVSHAREIRRIGAAVVVMAFDEDGQATSFERRVSICSRAYHLLTEVVGMPASDIIFDPNILAIATGIEEHNSYAADFIRATEWIKENLPGAHVSGGVSNLSFAFRGNNWLREAIHAVFLYHANQAGMDLGIVNPASSLAYSDIPAEALSIIEDSILNRTTDACERLTALATKLKEQEEAQASDSSDGKAIKEAGKSNTADEKSPVAARLVHAIRSGNSDTLEADLSEALNQYGSPLEIIDGPLMEGMKLVGALFGDGKMFLPQVVKAARTMKNAVEILQPHISKLTAEDNSSKKPKVLLATVKGDVHDIGKNIVNVIMACNGYEVIDLGVMVASETIVKKAIDLKPDVIGLSGLITPSLEEMVRVVAALREAGIHVPVLIGGATTSPLHTALKIAPVYGGPVIHVKDASQNVPTAARFIDPETASEAIASLKAKQEELRHQAETGTPSLIPIKEARRKKSNFSD